MTVKELIADLKEFHPNTEVVVETREANLGIKAVMVLHKSEGYPIIILDFNDKRKEVIKWQS